MNNLDILSLADPLAEDETQSFSCPFCHAEWERSLSVTKRADKILYNCFRAKCGRRGAILLNGTYINSKKKEKRANNRLAMVETSTPSKELYDFLYSKYGLTKNTIGFMGIKEDIVNGRIVFRTIGSKRWKHSNQPKWISYQSALDYNVDWFDGGVRGQPLVLVEDFISMSKLYQMSEPDDIYPRALFGTNLNIKDFPNPSETKVILALDPDATAKAIKYKLMYGSLFRSFDVAILDKDPKDMSEDEIEEKILCYV